MIKKINKIFNYIKNTIISTQSKVELRYGHKNIFLVIKLNDEWLVEYRTVSCKSNDWKLAFCKIGNGYVYIEGAENHMLEASRMFDIKAIKQEFEEYLFANKQCIKDIRKACETNSFIVKYTSYINGVETLMPII